MEAEIKRILTFTNIGADKDQKMENGQLQHESLDLDADAVSIPETISPPIEEEPVLSDIDEQSEYIHLQLESVTRYNNSALLPTYDDAVDPPPSYDSLSPIHNVNNSESCAEVDLRFIIRHDGCAIATLLILFLTVVSATLVTIITET